MVCCNAGIQQSSFCSERIRQERVNVLLGQAPFKQWIGHLLHASSKQKRNCVLHTDGAKGYQLEIEGLKHDHVVHKTRKLVRNGKPVKKNGRFVWIKPQYTKTFTHTAASSKKFKCKGGTQVIDCFWRHLHGYLKHRSFAVRSLQFATRVRSAQWAYWHRHDDLWLETGKMLRRLSVA